MGHGIMPPIIPNYIEKNRKMQTKSQQIKGNCPHIAAILTKPVAVRRFPPGTMTRWIEP